MLFIFMSKDTIKILSGSSFFFYQLSYAHKTIYHKTICNFLLNNHKYNHDLLLEFFLPFKIYIYLSIYALLV